MCRYSLLFMLFSLIQQQISSFRLWMTGRPALVVVLAGPTAVGKSRLAHDLARRLGAGALVSADSVQVYRGVEIGANKPHMMSKERKATLLLDVVGEQETYSAGDWRRDALFTIQELTGTTILGDDDEEESNSNGTKERWEGIREKIQDIRAEQQLTDDQPLIPIVVGGTMMYLQWLLYGQPDAVKPTADAVERARKLIEELETYPWEEAKQIAKDSYLSQDLHGPVDKLSGNDWYRLRRILEVMYSSSVEEDRFQGYRRGGLLTEATAGQLDVRYFFVCPEDRMRHTTTVDKRCEQMLQKGLLQETAELYPLPDMVSKAIGYRQTLTYLSRPDPKPNDTSAFEAFLAEFAAVTRRYAKKQMQWFRRDANVCFVPPDLDAVERLVRLPRQAYDAELGSVESESALIRSNNEAQGKGMKFYQYKPVILRPGTDELEEVMHVADECTDLLHSKASPSINSSTDWRLQPKQAGCS